MKLGKSSNTLNATASPSSSGGTSTSSNTTTSITAESILLDSTTTASILEIACKRERDFEDEEAVEDGEGEKGKVSVGTKSKSKQQKIRMPQRKGGMQLWQFLYALLEDPEKRYSELIEWTDNRLELEFRLLDPEAIAIWWGNIKHRANMTYERLSRSLRYYYDRGILKKMGGERYLYRFCVDPEEMYKHIGNSDSRPILKPMPLQVTKWMYSRMVIPHGVFFSSTLAPPDYSTAIQQQAASSSLPPPPPYPGFPVDPFYLPNPVGYDYLTHISQETETPYGNMPQYDNTVQLQLPTANTTLAGTPLSTFGSLNSSQCHGRSLSESLPPPISRENQQLSFPSQIPTGSYPSSPLDRQLLETVNSSSSCYQVGDGVNSPGYSGSTCSGGDCEMALDEILPILASMEHSETLLDVTSSPSYSSPSASPKFPNTPSILSTSSSLSSTTNSICSGGGYTQTFTNWLKTSTEHELWN